MSKKFCNENEKVVVVDCCWVAHVFCRINDAVEAAMKMLLLLKGLGHYAIPVANSNQNKDAKRIWNEKKNNKWRKLFY